jgi:hypothetical protein
LRRSAISLHSNRPGFGLEAIGLADGLHGLFASAFGANLGAADPAAENDSRDFVLMTADYSALAIASNATSRPIHSE